MAYRNAAGLAVAVILSGAGSLGQLESSLHQSVGATSKVLKVCTAGDYPPLTSYNVDADEYSGFAPALLRNFAQSYNYSIEFVRTPWPKLTEYLSNGLCLLAAGGIARTPEREANFITSQKVLDDRKAAIFSKSNAVRFKSFADIDAKDVVIIENRGGTNEAYAQLLHSSLVLRRTSLQVVQANEEVFACLDAHASQPLVMFTDLTEVLYRASFDSLLSNAGVNFTMPKGIDPEREKVYLARKSAAGQALMKEVDAFLALVKGDGRFDTWKRDAFAAKYPVNEAVCPLKLF
jgi:cyclohexadienyl dehydratase